MNEYSSLSDCKISLPVRNYPLKTLRKYSTIHKYTTINQLLDKCLIELFKRLDIIDLLSLRLVNSRFNNIIQRNFNRLAKKKFFGELHIDKLNKPLRHMRCLNISVEYANLSDQLLLELQRCIRNSVQTLELNYSSLLCSFQVFSKLEKITGITCSKAILNSLIAAIISTLNYAEHNRPNPS
uniref:F-box domain-containing protein n=1 Tax=Ditylenchus dipsaci TaxID=166011 RepID=A0A915D2Y5_9BILA